MVVDSTLSLAKLLRSFDVRPLTVLSIFVFRVFDINCNLNNFTILNFRFGPRSYCVLEQTSDSVVKNMKTSKKRTNRYYYLKYNCKTVTSVHTIISINRTVKLFQHTLLIIRY